MAAAIQAALGIMGFPIASQYFICVTQGMLTLDEFALLDDDEVENLIKVIRRPGGLMVNPNAAVAGQPPTIPNPGMTVTLRATNNLKLMCYYMKHREKTSRVLDPALVTLDAVRRLKPLK